MIDGAHSWRGAVWGPDQQYLKAAISYRGIHRLETLPVPDEALREALLNALIHWDYSVGAPIQIRVRDDRLSIWNPGELPEGWSLEKFLEAAFLSTVQPVRGQRFLPSGRDRGRGARNSADFCGLPRGRDTGTTDSV